MEPAGVNNSNFTSNLLDGLASRHTSNAGLTYSIVVIHVVGAAGTALSGAGDTLNELAYAVITFITGFGFTPFNVLATACGYDSSCFNNWGWTASLNHLHKATISVTGILFIPIITLFNSPQAAREIFFSADIKEQKILELKKKDNEISELKSQVKTLKEQIQNAPTPKPDSDQELLSKNNEISELKARFDALNEQLQIASQKALNLDQQLSLKDNEISQLKAQLDRLSEQLQKASEEAPKPNNEQQLQDKDKEILGLKEQITELEKKLEQTKTNNAFLLQKSVELSNENRALKESGKPVVINAQDMPHNDVPPARNEAPMQRGNPPPPPSGLLSKVKGQPSNSEKPQKSITESSEEESLLDKITKRAKELKRIEKEKNPPIVENTLVNTLIQALQSRRDNVVSAQNTEHSDDDEWGEDAGLADEPKKEIPQVLIDDALIELIDNTEDGVKAFLAKTLIKIKNEEKQVDKDIFYDNLDTIITASELDEKIKLKLRRAAKRLIRKQPGKNLNVEDISASKFDLGASDLGASSVGQSFLPPDSENGFSTTTIHNLQGSNFGSQLNQSFRSKNDLNVSFIGSFVREQTSEQKLSISAIPEEPQKGKIATLTSFFENQIKR